MYPTKELKERVPKGKKLATYRHTGHALYHFTYWSPDYGKCESRSIYFQELEANIKELKARGYHVINMDELMYDVSTSTYVKRKDIMRW